MGAFGREQDGQRSVFHLPPRGTGPILFPLFFFSLSSYPVMWRSFLIYLFLAALGLHCCVRAFSSCGKQGLLFVAVRGLLIAVASLVAEHGF